MIPTTPRPVLDFDVPTYGGSVLLYSDRAKWHAAEAALSGETDYKDGNPRGAVARLVFADGKAVYIVGLFCRDPAIIAHECGHLALFVFDRAGVDPICGNGEPFCYLLDTLYTTVSQALKKRRPKRRTASQSV